MTTSPSSEELPSLPRVGKPLIANQEQLLASVAAGGDVAELAALLSGGYLDDLLAEVFDALPAVAAAIGPGGVRLQSRPSNSVNALTVPTAAGATIVYNLGLFGLLYSVACAAAVEISAPDPATVGWLSALVDWATSPAAEPRTGPLDPPDEALAVDDEVGGLATKLAGPAQRFALCHELGHVLALSTERASVTTAPVPLRDGRVDAVVTSHEREFAADAAGFAMLLDLLASRGRPAFEALLGVELFLNTVAMMQPFARPAEQDTHPDPDERLHRLRLAFRDRFGLTEEVGPAILLQQLLYSLRSAVVPAVTERRAAVTRELDAAVAAFLRTPGNDREEVLRPAGKAFARHLLRSPGATLAYLRDGLAAPDTATPTRQLLLVAALHLELPLQTAIGVPQR